MLSSACKYAIKSTIYIALNSQSGEKVNIKDIAKNIESPLSFTAKILQKLVKHEIVLSSRGVGGGFWIKKNQLKNCYIIDIIAAIDGSEFINECILGLSECSEKNPCPAHKNYKDIKSSLIEMFNTTSLDEMVKDIEKEKAFLKLI